MAKSMIINNTPKIVFFIIDNFFINSMIRSPGYRNQGMTGFVVARQCVEKKGRRKAGWGTGKTVFLAMSQAGDGHPLMGVSR